MRVAVVTQYFPTSAQPWAGHSAYQTLKRLAQQCEVCAFYPEAVYPGVLRPKTGGATLDRTWQPAGVAAQYIPYPALPMVSRPLNGFTIAHRLLPHVRAWRPDVILNYVVYPDGYAAVRIGEALGVPVVLTAIGSDLNRIPGRLVRSLTQSTLRRADFTTTVSGDLLRTARMLGADPARSAAILNGCDTTVFHPRDRQAARAALGVAAEAKVILYAGRLDLRKGLRELVEAVAGLHLREPDLRCYLLGDGPDKPVLQQAIARHGLENTVLFVPAAQTETVAQWMAAADVFTLPSYKEGCPNVVLEALASGRPVVATDVGGIPELMDAQSGRLVPAMDAAALETALEETLRQQWGAESIAARHHRSWQDVSDDLLATLQALQPARPA
ncbi:MAG: glycosyltransferase [Janthinobacterium lividum]